MTSDSESGSSYPEGFAVEEPLVRIIRSPQFAKGGVLKASAFRPQRATSKVSIVRWLYRETPGELFKARCKAVGDVGQNSYTGIAVFDLEGCEAANVCLEDAREEYPGHAHVVYPFAIAKQEPPEGEAFKAQVEISHKLHARAHYLEDPSPEADHWTIESELLQ